jgi:small subunit ribosomal protein S20
VPSSKSINKVVGMAERKRLRNRLVRGSTRTQISKVRRLITSRELDSAKQEMVATTSSIDKAVSKGVIHRNKGARLKSRLMRKLNAAVVVDQSNVSYEQEAKQPRSKGEVEQS